jgi:nucleoside-diphosphate kinase
MRTLTIIKPDGVNKKLVGECLKRFESAGLEIEYLKVTKLTKNFMKKFYKHLKVKLNKKLFTAIINYLSSGKVVICILEGENAVEKVKKIVGVTNPKKAAKGTIRNDFATDDMVIRVKQNKAVRNIVHASGSPKEALEEIKLVINC